MGNVLIPLRKKFPGKTASFSISRMSVFAVPETFFRKDHRSLVYPTIDPFDRIDHHHR